MNIGADQLAKSITGKNSLGECSAAELQRLIAQYPYFGPAHFLLAQKLKEGNEAGYQKQFQKASLFFQNPLWLEWIAGNHSIGKIVSETKESFAAKAEPAETVVEEKTNTAKIIDFNEPVQKEKQQISATEHIETVNEITPAETFHGTVIEEEVPEKENTTGFDEKPEPEKTEASVTEETEPAIEIPQLKTAPVEASEQLTFEPYHTVDYFASQGIRLKEEEKPQDKFGQQLKSFTEWLKAMKRLPESQTIAPQTAIKDPKVEQMAEHSVEDGDVVTETMAGVWEKQGNHAKAIETYQKLSLLNPAKSSYFAAKIEYLKQL